VAVHQAKVIQPGSYIREFQTDQRALSFDYIFRTEEDEQSKAGVAPPYITG
jgi:hypothetical protein